MIQELQQAVDANAETLHEAASAGAAAHGPASAGHSLGEQISHNILHHISNGNTLEVPFLGEIDLPRFQVFGVDMSITRHVVMMWMAGLILLLLFGWAFRRRRLVPSGIATVLELGVQFVHEEIAVKTLGEKDAKRLSPFLLTIFFFILTCNLLGLVPYCSTATGNINVTGSLALMALVMIQLEGIRKFGFINHYKHLIPRGLPAYMFPLVILIFAIELFGFVVIKPFALMVRLFANMTAGHVAILALISIIFALQLAAASLFSIPFALFVYTLELLIALIQAYIFTILTSVFIGLQLHPSH
jgi:F-type H+-transporting ATPase subunit a